MEKRCVCVFRRRKKKQKQTSLNYKTFFRKKNKTKIKDY